MRDNPSLPRGLHLDVKKGSGGFEFFDLKTPETLGSGYYRTNVSPHVVINKTHLMLFRLVVDLNENLIYEVGRFMDSTDITFEDARLLSVGQVSDATKERICHVIFGNLVHDFKMECDEGLQPVWVYFRANYEKILESYLEVFRGDEDIDYEEFLMGFEEWWSDVMADEIDSMKDLEKDVMEHSVPFAHMKLVNLARVGDDKISSVLGDYFAGLREFDYDRDSWTDVLKYTRHWVHENVDEVFELLQYSMRDRLIDEMDEFYEREWDKSSPNPQPEKSEEDSDVEEKSVVADDDDGILEDVKETIKEFRESGMGHMEISRRIGSRIGGLTHKIKAADDEDYINVLEEGKKMYREFLSEMRTDVRDNPQGEDGVPDNMFYCEKCDGRHYQDSKAGYNHRKYGEGIVSHYYKMEGDTWTWAIPAMSEYAAEKTAEVAIGEEPDEIEEVDVTDSVLQESVKKIGLKTREKVAEKAGVSQSDFFIFNPPIDYPTMDTPLIYMGGAVSVDAENKNLDLDDSEYMMCHVNNETIWILPFERIGKEKSKEMEKMVPDDAIDDYELFNNEEYDSVSEVEISLPSSDSLWNDLGEVTSEVYTSDKEGLGEDQKYIHHHDEDDKPRLYQLDDIFVIAGGKMSITDWVYD